MNQSSPKQKISTAQADLAIRGEQIQRLYNFYVNDRFFVNRRYQRKLVWTRDQKQQFIDSLSRGLPVPIILLAERSDASSTFEIIDGLQRLNAIVSFVEQEFPFNGKYFDLDTMVESKSRLDSNLLTQSTPKLERTACANIASYVVPLSIYPFKEVSEIDEVFRRINSYGRYLSAQELRTAGATNDFAQVVRQIATKIRGDVSSSDVLQLKEMSKISLDSQDLKYGVNLDTVFWVQQGILSRELVRQSRDEEIVADLIASMISSEMPPASREIFDEYYYMKESERFRIIDANMKKFGNAKIESDYMIIHNELRIIFEISKATFNKIVLGSKVETAPRYFSIVFLALHKLLVSENKEIKDSGQLIKLLTNCAENMTVSTGGRWSASDKQNNISSIYGRISSAFREKKKSSKTKDVSRDQWSTELENILTLAATEQVEYDFKIGFTSLSSTVKGKTVFEDSTLTKVVKTLVGMVTSKPDSKAFVIVGIADKSSDAKKVESITGVSGKNFKKYVITGIEHDLKLLGVTIDKYYQSITTKIQTMNIDDKLKQYILSHIRVPAYFDRSIVVFEAEAPDQMPLFEGKVVAREGANIVDVTDQRKILELAQNYTRVIARSGGSRS